MDAYCATIVIPLLHQVDDWLDQSVRSAVEQSVPVEVLVITSPDTTASNHQVLDNIARTFSNINVILRPPGGNFSTAINAGFAAAATERVGLLLSDDWLARDAIENCIQHPEELVTTGRTGFAANGKDQVWENVPNAAKFNLLATMEARASYIGHFFLFKREKFLAVGGVDSSIGLTGADDYDLIWTLLEHNARVHVIEQSLYNYRDHDGIRLTMRAQKDQVLDLKNILAKHGVTGAEQDRLVAEKSKWYGVPGYQVIHRLATNPE